MEEAGKLPLKRVELSLTKFNEVAIPHHLDLLRQHKANIIKYGECGDSARVRSEQTHARRVAGQLRVLLQEMDALRRQVRPEEWDRFDALTQRSRDLTLRAIVDYLGVIERSCRALVGAGREMTRWRESSPVTIRRIGGGAGGGEGGEALCGSAVSTESVGVVAHAPQLQLQHDDQELQLKEREEVLRGWCELQAEVHALHESWRLMQDAAVLQRQQVTTASESIEVAAVNVQEARRSLSIAERSHRCSASRNTKECLISFLTPVAQFRRLASRYATKPEDLTEAGFFYTGHADRTKCFHCGGGLKDWEDDDNPWQQHVQWFSQCAYVMFKLEQCFV